MEKIQSKPTTQYDLNDLDLQQQHSMTEFIK